MNTKLLQAIGEAYVEHLQAELIIIGLKDSNIINNISYKINNNTIEIILPDYSQYIESGRRANTKRVPIQILLKWMIRKGIPNSIKIAFAIQTKIFKVGIRPRPFIENSINKTDENIENLIKLYVDNVINAEIKILQQDVQRQFGSQTI